MRNIEIDEDLYQYIASKTEIIGESASDILRRLLGLENNKPITPEIEAPTHATALPEDNVVDDVSLPATNEDAPTPTEEKVVEEKPAIDAHLTLPRKRRTKKKATQERAKTSPSDLPSIEGLVTPMSFADAEQFVEKIKQSEEFQQCASSAKRFLCVLGMLSQQHGESFAVVEHVQGAERLYFARELSALEAAGSSTNPRHIPHSDYWVVTNSNTERKRSMIAKVCHLLGYAESHIEQITAAI